jgi:hypothetical protein
VQIVDTNFKSGDPSYTIEAWVNPSGAIAQEWVIAGRSGAIALAYNAWDGFSPPINGFHATAGYAGISFFNGNAFDVTLSSARLPVNQWTYLAGTWNNTTKSLNLYVNGVLDRTQTFAGQSPRAGDPFGNFQVGGFDDSLHGGTGKSEYFQGKLDEVAYYSSALTPAQIQQHYKAATASDIVPTSLTWNTTQGGVDFSYEVTGADLPRDTTAALYWASGTTTADIIQSATVNTQTVNDKLVIPAPRGTAGIIHFDVSDLTQPPPAATYLLAVVDPNNLIDEGTAGEANNVLPLTVNDIAMTSAQIQGGNAVQFTFETTGNPGPFQVGLYRSTDGITFNPADLIATQTVTPASLNPQSPGTFTLPSGFSADVAHPYLVVVADPANQVNESNAGNNEQQILAFQQPTITLTILPVNAAKGESYDVRATITSQSLVTTTPTIGCDEYLVSFVGDVLASSASGQNVILTPGSTTQVSLGTFSHTWEWIPHTNPIETIPTTLDAIRVSLQSAIRDGLLNMLRNGLGTITGHLTDAITELDRWFNGLLLPTTAQTYLYKPLVDGLAVGTPVLTTLGVPFQYQAFYWSSVALESLGSRAADLAIAAIAIQPEFAIGLLASAGSLFNSARLSYDQAIDPPDPNFTEIATPHVLAIPELSQLPTGLLLTVAQPA